MYTTDVLEKRMTDGAYDAELSKLYPSGTVDAQKKRYPSAIHRQIRGARDGCHRAGNP